MIKLALAAALLAAPAWAAPTLGQAAPMAMPMPAPSGDAATTAYRKASQSMMAGMDVPYTGDADRDFIAGMLPHHQGAIDMARVELQCGRDPALKRLARAIVGAQQKEQAFMRAWQAKHPMATAQP